ncbi:MAG: MoxR family ATPase [Gammaproteobacteria bacterium]|nr:MoxR family ATPase [Gammaproteobacteria bacterium]
MISVKELKNAIDDDVPLLAVGSWPEAAHRLDKDSAYAIIAALAAGRPLLVRGEPGAGKSQLARAAAELLNRRFISTVVQPSSEYQDLLWTFDHVKRLSDAQLQKADGSSAIKPDNDYIAPGPLWWALAWGDAEGRDCKNVYQPDAQASAPSAESNGVVLLVDEIDKADIALANGLLEALGNGSFSVPPLGKSVPQDPTDQNAIKPLVIITSNDTRDLPPAMIRRCVVHEIRLPEGDQFRKYLVKIGRAHFKNIEDDILKEAATQIEKDRRHQQGQVKTGVAEYIDLLRALRNISDDPEQQLKWLATLNPYFVKGTAARV